MRQVILDFKLNRGVMYCFVAFLRGINVGGHIVVKETLQKAFASMGFQNVSIYKQSGNVIFETIDTNPEEIRAKIESSLKASLGYEVPVFLRTVTQLKAIISLGAFRGQNGDDSSFLVTFLASPPSKSALTLPATIPKSTAQIISSQGTEVFSVTHGGGEGGLPNPFLESKLKVKATTRNLNIIVGVLKKYG